MPVRETVGTGDQKPTPPQPQPEPTQQVQPPRGYQPQTTTYGPASNISAIEKASKSTLPTDVVLKLSGLSMNERDRDRAANMLARFYDVSPQAFFGQKVAGHYVSPITGGPISMKEALRFTDQFTPTAIAGLLSQVTAGKQVGLSQTIAKHRDAAPGYAGISVTKTARFARELAKRFPQLDMQTGIGIAGVLSRQKVGHNRYVANLDALLQWEGSRGMAPDQVALLAASATKDGAQWHGAKDVVLSFLAAEDAKNGTDLVGQYNSDVSADQEARQTYDPEHDAIIRPTTLESGVNKLIRAEIPNDLSAEVKALSDQVVMENTAFERSWFGRNIWHPTMTGLTYAQDVGYRGFIELMSAIDVPAAVVQGILPGGDDSVASQIAQMQEWRSSAINKLNSSHSIGKVLGFDGWAAVGWDFTVGWLLDPVAVAGGALNVFRAGRVLGEVGRSESLISRAVAIPLSHSETAVKLAGYFNDLKVTRTSNILERFTNSRTVTKGLFDAMKTSDEAFLNRIFELTARFNANEPLDPEFMLILRREIMQSPLSSSADQLAMLQDGIRAHLTIWAPQNSPAGIALEKRFKQTVESTAAVKNLPPGSLKGGLIASNIPDQPGLIYHNPLRFEVPRRSLPIPGFGARKAISGGFYRQGLDELPGMRRVGRLLSLDPGTSFNIHDNPLEYIRLWGHRSSRLSEAQIAEFQSRVTEANLLPEKVPGDRYLVEKADPFQVVADMSVAHFDAKVAKYNLSDEAKAELHKWVFDPYARANARPEIFGIAPADLLPLPDVNQLSLSERQGIAKVLKSERKAETPMGGVVTNPWTTLSPTDQRLFDLQLNDWVKNGGGAAPDFPVAAVPSGPEARVADRVPGFDIHDIASRMGVNLDDEATLRRAVGLKDKELKKPVLPTQTQNTAFVPDPVFIDHTVDRYIGMRRRITTAVRGAARKQGPEIEHELTDLLARTSNKALNISGDGFRAYRRLWKSAAVARPAYITRVILLDENARYIFTTSLADRLLSHRLGVTGRLLDKVGIGNDAFRFPDGEVMNLPRAGSKTFTGYEPSVVNAVRETDLMREAVADAALKRRSLQATGLWKAVEPPDPGHLAAWAEALTQPIARAAPGRAALVAIRDGGSVDDVARALENWAVKDRFRFLEFEMGIDRADVDQWAAEAAAMVQSYTKGSPEIAAAALSKIPTEDFAHELARLVPDVADRPAVHGLEVTATFGKSEPRTWVNGLYKLFVSHPEDVLNRQPFYRTMKRQAMSTYMDAFQKAGITPSEDMLNAFDVGSRQFGLEQVRRVMFDASRQHRLTELANYVIPFPQPFIEGFTAWGHIALYRNAQTFSHFRQLFHAGVQSGFITKDDNGEWVVPIVPIRMLTHKLGWLPEGVRELYGPLSSFNMLASTTVPISSTGWGSKTIGAFAGGLPLPVPSPDPLLSNFLQWSFKNTQNEQITAWLYQYGPTTKMIPTPIVAAINFFAPQVFSNEILKTRTLDMLRVYKHEHAYENLSETELIAQAEGDAKDMLAAIALGSLLGPTTPRPEYVYSDVAQSYYDKITELGQDKAQDWLFKNHPDDYLLAIGKTFYDDVYEGRTVPRVPASEFAAKVAADPKIQQALTRSDPAWLGLLLAGSDPNVVNDFNFFEYAKQIRAGLVKPAEPEAFLARGEDLVAWREVDHWNKVVWNPAVAKATEQGYYGDYNDPRMRELQSTKNDFLIELATTFPGFEERNLVSIPARGNPGVTAAYRFRYEQDGTPSNVIMKNAKDLVNTPGLEGFSGIQALKGVLNKVYDMSREMKDKGFTGIYDADAQESGLTDRYNKMWTNLEKNYPDASPIIQTYLRGVLGDSESAASATFNKLPQASKDAWIKFQGRYDTLVTKARETPVTSLDETSGWAKVQDFLTQQWLDHPKALVARAKFNMPPGSPERKQFLLDQIDKPVIFQDPFTLHLMGIDLDKKGVEMLQNVSAARLDISRNEYEDPVGFASGAAYDALEVAMDAYDKQNASFAQFHKASQQFGWIFEATGLTNRPGIVGEAFTNIVDAAQQIQQYADDHQLQGINYGTDAERSAYDSMKKNLAAGIEAYKKTDETGRFKKAWEELQGAYGTSNNLLLDILVPDDYYGR